MKIFILSRNINLYSTTRIEEAGRKRGHLVRVIDYMRCYMNITSRRPIIYYGGESLKDVDAIIPRIGASNTFYGTAVVRQFETMDCFCLNPSISISNSVSVVSDLTLNGEIIIVSPNNLVPAGCNNSRTVSL